MDTQNLSFNDSCDGEVIKEVSGVLPGVDVSILSLTLLIEAVELSNLSGFVISSKKGDSARVFYLEAKEKLDGLYGIIPSIDKVTNKDVAGVGDLATDSEEFEDIVKLSVDVATYADGGLDGLDVGFFSKDFLSKVTEKLVVTLRQALS